MRRTLAIGVLGMLALVACGGEADPAATPTAATPIPGAGDCPAGGVEKPDPRPSSPAKITVLSPSNGDVIRQDSVTVRVRVTKACILEQATVLVRPDTGHVHVALDGRTLTQLAGTEYEVTDLTPGLHKLEVSFAAADHLQFSPPVLKTVTFRVAP